MKQRSIRIKVDVGQWFRKERVAETVSLSVREESSRSYYSGVGAAVCAPEDMPYESSDKEIGAAIEFGVALALERAIEDAKLPFEYIPHVREFVHNALAKLPFEYIPHVHNALADMPKTQVRTLGDGYYRITKRVVLTSRPSLRDILERLSTLAYSFRV